MPPSSATRRVLLVHGLWLGAASMRWIGARLYDAGFEPATFDYATVHGAPEDAGRRLAEAIGDVPTHLVAHSLGGLVALGALRLADLPVPRLVCLGSPLCGSAAARNLLQRVPVAAHLLGRSAPLLQEGCAPWQGATQVGSIAGSTPHGLGQLFGTLEGGSDGTVAVAETRLEGLADHIVVPASHSGLVFSHRAARQAVAFLRDGRFIPETARARA